MDSEESAERQAALRAFERVDMVGADARAESMALRCVDARKRALLVVRGPSCADHTLLELERELEAELSAFSDLTVELDFYESAPLLLREPRQRTKLVRYVLEQARALLLCDRDEVSIDWRSAAVLVATKSVRLKRTMRTRLAGGEHEGRGQGRATAVDCDGDNSIDGMQLVLVNRGDLPNQRCTLNESD